MIVEILAIGDEAVINGEIATIVKFDETFVTRFNWSPQKPGVYENKTYVDLQLQNGPRLLQRHSSEVTLVDQNDVQKRIAALRQKYEEEPIPQRFLRDLPETKFYEEDIVAVPELKMKEGYSTWSIHSYPIPIKLLKKMELHEVTARVRSISYDTINEGGTQFYWVSGNCRSNVNEDEIALVKRGNVWKYFHNEPISFQSIEEEANFFRRLGHFEEVKNPFTSNYHWQGSHYFTGIRGGIIDASFHESLDHIPDNNPVTAIKFTDSELGDRVRIKIVSLPVLYFRIFEN